MGFIDDWNEAIENDPYWQFEDLLEEEPELAELSWDNLRIATLVANRLGVAVSLVQDFMEQPNIRSRICKM